MRHTRTTLLAAVAFTACALVAHAADRKPAKQSPEHMLMASLREQLVLRLKDAESARFKGEFLSLSDSADAPIKSLCGEVNAKNSYGGYVGFKRFVVTSEGMVSIEGPDGPSFEYVWPVWCARPVR